MAPNPSTVPMRVSDEIVGPGTPLRRRSFDCSTLGNDAGQVSSGRCSGAVPDRATRCASHASMAPARKRERGSRDGDRLAVDQRPRAAAGQVDADPMPGDLERDRAADRDRPGAVPRPLPDLNLQVVDARRDRDELADLLEVVVRAIERDQVRITPGGGAGRCRRDWCGTAR